MGKKNLLHFPIFDIISVLNDYIRKGETKQSMGHYSTQDIASQYSQAKGQNVKLWQSLKRIGDERWFNVSVCSQVIKVRFCPECGRTHTETSFCCRHRLCPVCAVRKSHKTGRQALEAFEYMEQQGQLEGASLWLITLTQRNVSSDNLKTEIDGLLSALISMRHTQSIRRRLLGSARNIEITYNRKTRTFHPHVHMIAIIKDGDDDMYKPLYWRSLWQRLMNLDYEPICDIRHITDTQGAVCEVSKYAIKPSSIYDLKLSKTHMDDVVRILNDALTNRRLVSYTGIWREARKLLKQVDVDLLTLEQDDNSSVCGCGANLMEAMLKWDGLVYVPFTTE